MPAGGVPVPWAGRPYQSDNNIAELIMRAGQQRAALQQQMFQGLAGSVEQLGQIPGQIQRQKQIEAQTKLEEARAGREETLAKTQQTRLEQEQKATSEGAQQDQKFMGLLQSGQDPDPRAILEIYGPHRGIEIIKGMAAYKEVGRKSGAEALKEVPDLVNAYAQLSPEGRTIFWPHLRELAVKAQIVDPAKVPEQRSDDFDAQVIKFGQGLKEQKPDNRSLEVRLAAAVPGSPEAQQILGKMHQQAAATRAPEKPDTKAADKAAARAEAIDAAATSIESGQPGASVPQALRAEAENEARKRGARVYTSEKQKTAVNNLESIKRDADRARELLEDKDVQGYLGKGFTGLTSAVQEWPVIGGQVPDKVREAISLMGDLTDRRLRERSGAAISPGEFTRISKFSLGSGLAVRTLQLNAKKLAEELNAKIEAEVGAPKTQSTAPLKVGRFTVEVE